MTLSAGPDRTLVPPATSLRLEGKFTFPTLPWVTFPNPITVQWVQLSGPPVAIADGHTLKPLVTPSHAGTIELRMNAYSARTGWLSDQVQIHAFGNDQDAAVAGTARKWHKLELSFVHDQVLSETGPLNPFLDLRLMAYFLHGATGTVRSVPGFFAADGNAAETSATAGNVWRVNFTPDLAGTWHYLVSFRTGVQVALNPLEGAGTPLSFNDANGSLYVEPADPTAPGFLSKGRLEYVGSHHLRFAETREHFLKNGAGSPENFLGYYEFDGTTDQGGASSGLSNFPPYDGLHHYDAHLADYVDLGVPTWKNGKGRRIFGALSYLASRGVNSLYALTYNIDGGDGAEVWPWTTPTQKLRYDVSKLAQWERVVDHMQRAGIVWHVMTQEFENDHVLSGGGLGVQRALYYRELVARFGHALGLVWNLGEENTNSTAERKAFAEALHALDPYSHPVSLHHIVGQLNATFDPLLGTHLEMVSMQGDPTMTPPRAQLLVQSSAAAGRPWVVNFDEQTPAQQGVLPDAVDFWHDIIRRESLWPMLLGQGGGCEWYFGYGNPNTDLDCEDFRSRDNLWVLATRAREFVRDHAPFQVMSWADGLALGTGPSVLAESGRTYLVYLPFGGAVSLDLEGNTGPFAVSWFDARNGGPLVPGAITQVAGPGQVSLGAPPGGGDWVAFVRLQQNESPRLESVTFEPAAFVPGQDFSIQVHVSDPNGPADTLQVSAQFIAPGGIPGPSVPLVHVGGTLYTYFAPDAPAVTPGAWQVALTVQDEAGATYSKTFAFQATTGIAAR